MSLALSRWASHPEVVMLSAISREKPLITAEMASMGSVTES